MCVCKRHVTYIDVFLPGIWVCYLKLSFHLEFPIIRTCVLLVSFSLFFLSAVILKCAGSASGSCYCRWLFCDNIYVACSSAGLALASSASLFQAALLLTVNTELSHQMSREHVFLGSWLWSVPSSTRVIAVPKPCLIPPGGIYQGFLAGNTQKVGHMGTAPSVCLFLKIADLQLRGEKKKNDIEFSSATRYWQHWHVAASTVQANRPSGRSASASPFLKSPPFPPSSFLMHFGHKKGRPST